MRDSTRYSALFLAKAGLIAAAYTVLTLLLQPIGFGVVQCRLSEALTVLPVLSPAAIPGLAVGCLLSNLIGLATGANPLGVWDVVLGTAATLVSACLTYALRRVRWGKFPVAATLPPVLVNALVIGTALWKAYGGWHWWFPVLCVLAGQSVACIGGGLLLFAALKDRFH